MQRMMSALLRFLIKAYQLTISPWLAPHCRYYPSCSTYALLAINYHGPIKGLWYSLRRLLRCHPWSEGGYDPILPNKENL